VHIGTPQGYFYEFEIMGEGWYEQMLGRGCKHAGSANLHSTTLKQKQLQIHVVDRGGGVVFQLGGSLPPRGVYKYHWYFFSSTII